MCTCEVPLSEIVALLDWGGPQNGHARPIATPACNFTYQS